LLAVATPPQSSAPPRPVAPELLGHARESRHTPTAAEKWLRVGLRAHRLGPHIRRLHPIGDRFIVRSFCADAGFRIEVDSDTHAKLVQPAYVAARTTWLNQRGYRMIGFTRADVFENPAGVLEAIRSAGQEEGVKGTV